MTVKQRYECATCGWRWSKDFQALASVAAIWPERTTVVPKCPGCTEEAE